MTEKHTSKLGQDLFDVVVQNYGTLEDGLENFIQLNPALDLGLDLSSGQEVSISPGSIGDVNNKEFFSINSSILNNADPSFLPILENYDFQNDGDYDFQNGENFNFN